MLLLPTENDTHPPLVASRAPQRVEPDAAVGAEVSGMTPHGNAGEGFPADESTDKSTSSRRRHAKKKSIPRVVKLTVAAVTVVMVIGLGWRMLAPTAAPSGGVRPVASAASAGKPKPERDAELDPAHFLVAAEPIARQFLTAKNVQELRKVIYRPQELEKKLNAFYPQGEVDPEGLVKFDVSGSIKSLSRIHQVEVQTARFDVRELTFVVTPSGLKVDWESWVGSSEMTWRDFVEKRPQQACEMRVVVSHTDYYNFEFGDDRQWRSYRLESADAETVLYGYVPRGSALEENLDKSLKYDGSRYILKMHFMPGDSRAKQVVIDQVVEKQWTQLAEEDQPVTK